MKAGDFVKVIVPHLEDTLTVYFYVAGFIANKVVPLSNSLKVFSGRDITPITWKDKPSVFNKDDCQMCTAYDEERYKINFKVEYGDLVEYFSWVGERVHPIVFQCASAIGDTVYPIAGSSVDVYDSSVPMFEWEYPMHRCVPCEDKYLIGLYNKCRTV